MKFVHHSIQLQFALLALSRCGSHISDGNKLSQVRVISNFFWYSTFFQGISGSDLRNLGLISDYLKLCLAKLGETHIPLATICSKQKSVKKFFGTQLFSGQPRVWDQVN